MRVKSSIIVAAAFTIGASPAVAQGQSAATQNQATATKSAEKKVSTKANSDKICKRTANGKVCMTAEKWREYQEMF